MKVRYPHNQLRHQLSAEEKKRFNSYKKRECERRRRYRRSNRHDHPKFYLHRCEICWKFYETVDLLYGYSVCKTCPMDISKIIYFLKNEKKINEDLLADVTIESIQNRLLISPMLQLNICQELCHESRMEDIPNLFEESEMMEFVHDLYTIQLNADWEAQYLHNPNEFLLRPLMPWDEYIDEGINLVMKNFTFQKQNVDNE